MDFEYAAPQQLRGAVAALASPGSIAIAGGTELLNWMRLGIAAPVRLADIGGIQEARGVTLTDGSIRIGALTTLNELGEHALLREHGLALSQSCMKAASAQVRNRATIGGNVLQRTRCAYFRAEAPLPWACNKRNPGSGCAALTGLNERHAILGWTDACVATHPSDPAVALSALDATVEVVGRAGSRMIAMTDFHLTPAEVRSGTAGKVQARAQEAAIESRLGAGELIMAFHLPVRRGETSAYVKVRERESYEFALVSAAAALVLEGDDVAEVRIALGSVAQKPWRLRRAEQALAGRRLAAADVLDAVRSDLEAAQPLLHNRYKISLAAQAATRAVMLAGAAA